MNSRPKPGETEEDILKLQEEFLKNQLQPSAKYVNCKSSSDKKLNEQPEVRNEEIKPVDSPILLGGIVERKTQFVPPDFDSKSRFSGGFPQAKRRQNITSTKKGSIFAQQNKRLKDEHLPEPVNMITEDTASSSATDEKNLPAQSYIITGEERDQIHQENIGTLNKMSVDEILQEQQNLVSTMDPDIVRFLKSKRASTNVPSVCESEQVVNSEQPVNVQEIETAKGILENCDLEQWLHFDKIETEKLQWMKDIAVPKKLAGNEEYEARFDFAGWLLPYVNTEISEKNRMLYHHGEEPGRPGYTLKELFQLCRSSVQQQRILALNTIANILQLNSTGIYDDVIEIPIEQIFFILRVALDDNTPAVLNSSIRAMHSMFYYRVDEMCLDNLLSFGFGLVQPMLTADREKTTKKEEKEINDQQMAEMDLVKCLARSDILIRIRYIINTVKPKTETIVYCLELLIRLVRDSRPIMLQVYQCNGLFASIVQHFVPKIYQLNSDTTNCYGVPLPAAIKLLRILAARSEVISKELVNKYAIMPAICSYIATDIGTNTTGVQIQIEALNFLATVLHYKLGVDEFRELEYPLLRNLNYHFRHTNVADSSSTMQSHFAALMNILSQMTQIDAELISNIVPLLIKCVSKYCVQVSNLCEFKCGQLQIISSLLAAMGNIVKASSLNKYDYVEKHIEAMLRSPGFVTITNDIKLGSNLLCEYEAHKAGANFGSVEAAVWPTSEHILPCFHKNSCILFLTALSYYVEGSGDRLLLKFIRHVNIIKYLTALRNCSKFGLITNWFTRMEAQLLVNILSCVIVVEKFIAERGFFYEVTVKCLPVFNVEHKIDVTYLLRNIVFKQNFLPNEVPLENLGLFDDKFDTNAFDYLDDIYRCYCHVLGLYQNIDILITNLTLDNRIGNVMPADWIFSPIVAVYADHQTAPIGDHHQLRFSVVRCLQWVLVIETYFPRLAALVDRTERYCRIACVFLSSNALFLEFKVHHLLDNCLKMLLKDTATHMNFDREIQGLNNFQDFYVQLLEQYQGVSYGDTLFANYIMVPLTQKHNVKWRKILWSEYLGVAQTIMLTKEQCFIDIQEFLDPAETDLSVLKCYRRALVSGQLSRSPLLQEITNYHVDNYLRNKQ